MKKINKEEAYSMLIKLCVITIIACTILKWCGYKDFEIPLLTTNLNIHLRRFINMIFYCCNGVCFTLILIKRKIPIKYLIINILALIPSFIISLFTNISALILRITLEIFISFIISILIVKEEKKKYKLLIETIIIYLIIFVLQALTSVYKNLNLFNIPFMVDMVLQIDYYCVLLLIILKEIQKGGYIYGRWISIFLILSKRRCVKESIQQNQNNVQEIEFGFKLFIVLLSITQFFVVGVDCYFINGVIFEYIAIFISFVMMRKVFGKSYHSDSIIKCTTLAIVVFVTATRISLPLWLSSLCNVIIGCLVAYMMYVMYYYIKFTNIDGVTIYKGMDKQVLIDKCKLHKLTDVETSVMTMYYCDKLKRWQIGNKLGYSEDNISKIKDKVLKKFKESSES